MVAPTLIAESADAVLRAETAFLSGFERVMAEWLERRKEAVSQAHDLFSRMRESRDIGEVMDAQRTWMAGAFDRFAADAASCQKLAISVARQMGDEAERIGNNVAGNGSATVEAVRSAAGRSRAA